MPKQRKPSKQQLWRGRRTSKRHRWTDDGNTGLDEWWLEQGWCDDGDGGDTQSNKQEGGGEVVVISNLATVVDGGRRCFQQHMATRDGGRWLAGCDGHKMVVTARGGIGLGWRLC